MMLDPFPTYPTSRSYVLKLRRGTAGGRAVSGFIENLATGDRHDFDGVEQLHAVLANLVTDLEKNHE